MSAEEVAPPAVQRPEFGGWRNERRKPQKTAILVAKAIVREITERGLRPGDHLPPEHEMLREQGVGRGTLREALRYLELQGALEIKPGSGGGPVVARPDSRHLASTLALLMQFAGTPFRAVVDARIALEPTMAVEAARHAADLDIAVLRESVSRMAEGLGDREVFLLENDRFHSLIAFASSNPIFSHLQASLHWITDGSVLGVDYPERRRKDVLRAHDRICTAIEQRDTDAARQHMQQHMENFLAYLQRGYPALLDRELSWTDFAD